MNEFIANELGTPGSRFNRALQLNGYQRGPYVPTQTPDRVATAAPPCVTRLFETDIGQAVAAVLTPLANAAEFINNVVNNVVTDGRFVECFPFESLFIKSCSENVNKRLEFPVDNAQNTNDNIEEEEVIFDKNNTFLKENLSTPKYFSV